MKLYWRYKKDGKWTWVNAHGKKIAAGAWLVTTPAWGGEEE